MQERINMNGGHAVNGNHDATKRHAVNAVALQSLLEKVLKNWYWYAGAIVIMAALATFYIWYAAPGYKVNARVQVLNNGGQSPDNGFSGRLAEQLSDLGYGTTSNVDDEAQVLSSKSLAEKVVRDMDLNITYYAKNGIRKRELYNPRPFTMQWVKLYPVSQTLRYTVRPKGRDRFILSDDDTTREGAWNDTLHVPEGDLVLRRNVHIPFEADKYLVSVTSIGHAINNFMDRLNINIPNKQVSMIDLSYDSPIPEKGEAVLNKLIDTYIQLCIDDKNRIADSTIAFIDGRLGGVSGELTGIEKDIQQFRQVNDLANLQEQSRQLVTGSSDFMKLLTDQQVKLNVVESLESYMRDAANSKRVVPSSMIIQDPTFLGLVDKYNALQLERERRLLLSTESNPVIKNIDQQLSSLHSDMQNNLASLKRNIEVSINGLQAQSGNISRRMRQMPGEERLYLDYARQQSIKQELYIYLLKRREEAAISKTSHLVNVRVVDGARSEELPFKPRKDLIYLLALVLGAGLAGGGLYLHGLMNKKVLSKDDVTGTLPVPVLAEIGHSRKKELLIVGNGGTPVAEQFRLLRTDLQLMLNRIKGKVILLTSGTSGEGKTFVATNLAYILALSGKKTALLEMDLRNPGVCSFLNLRADGGFTDFANYNLPYEQLFQPSGIHHNCQVVPAGPIPENPSELLMAPQTAALMASLRENFDYIIIDSAPIGHVTDARILAEFADITLYVIRQQYTRKHQLQLVKDLYQHKKFPRLHIVINDIKLAGDSYGYSYGNFNEARVKRAAVVKNVN